MSAQSLPTVLVIGYGDPLRGDGAVGRLIVDQIKAWNIPHVEAIAVPQLTPKLAEIMTIADIVIFVDVYLSAVAQAISIHPLHIAESIVTMDHWCDPPTLLAFTQALWGRYPRSWWVRVPITNFAEGDRSKVTAKCHLTPMTKARIHKVLIQIEQLIKTERDELCMKLN